MITDQTRILFSNLSRSNLSNFSLFLSSFFFSFLYRFQFYFCIFPQPMYIWERERTKMGKGKHFLLFFIAKVVFVRYKKSACFFRYLTVCFRSVIVIHIKWYEIVLLFAEQHNTTSILNFSVGKKKKYI